MRAPFQTLIIPYKIQNETILYGIFFRKKQEIWQFIAGGGEDSEIAIQTAKRELEEETTIKASEDDFIRLESKSMIPVVNITGNFTWGQDVYVIPEYVFAIDVGNSDIKLSNEHKELKWLSYDEAKNSLKFDSNKTALWELNTKLERRL
ncbi:MAG: NUDIX pyrophosphatase [Clostridia bacterium]|nr:NUDIX pyrophosphatase [Clostridia bacterium]